MFVIMIRFTCLASGHFYILDNFLFGIFEMFGICFFYTFEIYAILTFLEGWGGGPGLLAY